MRVHTRSCAHCILVYAMPLMTFERCFMIALCVYVGESTIHFGCFAYGFEKLCTAFVWFLSDNTNTVYTQFIFARRIIISFVESLFVNFNSVYIQCMQRKSECAGNHECEVRRKIPLRKRTY